jgi:ABC-type multidrug transport system fused ATPase/permease subunit
VPTSGTQTVGGINVKEISGDDVRRMVGLVDDDPYVFASTVTENIRLARPTASDDDVARALEAAHLGTWLGGLPRGLATHLGEGNVQVSGGERARIGLARAILADPPVLVLDEPTAHLDTDTAEALTSDLLAASDARSLVWITHTSVGLDQMDEVIELGR